MNTIDEIADLLQQIVNSDNLDVIHATATRALELADMMIVKEDEVL